MRELGERHRFSLAVQLCKEKTVTRFGPFIFFSRTMLPLPIIAGRITQLMAWKTIEPKCLIEVSSNVGFEF